MDSCGLGQFADYDPQKSSFLVFSSARQYFALPHENIITVLDNPPSTKMPGMGNAARGVTDFMGEPVSYLDFRSIIGARSICEEVEDVAATLQARKQDHLNWIDTLKDEVGRGQEISVQTDPRLCAFGRWYDSFSSESLRLRRFVKRFGKPHQLIHGIAVTAKRLIAEGNAAEAMDLICRTENKELAELIRLFDSAKEELLQSSCEYAIIARNDEKGKVAIAIDELKFFGQLETITHSLKRTAGNGVCGFVNAYGFLRSEGVEEEIMIVDLNKLMGNV